MNKRKFNLAELKVKSFTTAVINEVSDTVKGGTTPGCGQPISAGGYNCYPSNSFN